MPLSAQEMSLLQAACRSLPTSSVQAEESEVAQDPVLLLMSTVLSLSRRWYAHALPARRHFESNVYMQMSPKTLSRFREMAEQESLNRTDWSALARKLWGMNEWGKARMLTELVDYFITWGDENAPGVSDMEALRVWSCSVPMDQFVSRIHGLGPRAYEQIRWYVDGQDAIKLDRHVLAFMGEVLGRPLSEPDILDALNHTARGLGISATTLDARIWDAMQARGQGKRGSVASDQTRAT